MAIHFLQSKAARTLNLAEVFRMTEGEAETAFRKIRWTDTQGEAVCPECGGVEPYQYRRPTGLLRFRCKACGKNFSITSGTLFASHKAPFRAYLAAIAVFLLWRRQLFTLPLALWVLMLLMPFPYIANEAGWVTTEVGRQPWIVYGLMKTQTAVSPNVVSGETVFTLIGFVGMYFLLGVLFVLLTLREIAIGPAEHSPAGVVSPSELAVER